jgi:hypothetical protein
MRVTVSAVVGQLASGQTSEQVLEDYPYFERDDILAALEYAAAAVSERELPVNGPPGVRLLIDANLSSRAAKAPCPRPVTMPSMSATSACWQPRTTRTHRLRDVFRASGSQRQPLPAPFPPLA